MICITDKFKIIPVELISLGPLMSSVVTFIVTCFIAADVEDPVVVLVLSLVVRFLLAT